MILNGIYKVLKGDEDWRKEFDLSAPALPKSFFAIFLCIILFMVVTKSAVKYNDNSLDAPFMAISAVLSIMCLSFPLIAYVICMIFDKQPMFRAWVIVRNWAFLCVTALISLSFGLHLFGLLPFSIAYILGLSLYLSTLAIDIRLATRIAKFGWLGSVFTAIFISMTNIMILYLGLTQILN